MIEKEFAASGESTIVVVRFTLPATLQADCVFLVGDFNHWQRMATPMWREVDGRWACTLVLEMSQLYQFRYLIDHAQWLSDPDADAYVNTPHGVTNAVIVTDPYFQMYRDKARAAAGMVASVSPSQQRLSSDVDMAA